MLSSPRLAKHGLHTACVCGGSGAGGMGGSSGPPHPSIHAHPPPAAAHTAHAPLGERLQSLPGGEACGVVSVLCFPLFLFLHPICAAVQGPSWAESTGRAQPGPQVCHCMVSHIPSPSSIRQRAFCRAPVSPRTRGANHDPSRRCSHQYNIRDTGRTHVGHGACPHARGCVVLRAG